MDISTAIREFLSKNQYERFCLKAVLFDMDGVLFDSMKNHTLAWYKTMKEWGIPCERDEFYLYEGRTGASTINLLFQRAYGRDATEEEIDKIYQRKSYFFNQMPETNVMPGAKELLEQVKKAGLIAVLVTGSGQHSLLKRLEREYPGVFNSDLVVTAYDVRHGKPHAEPYQKGLKKAGVAPCEAMIVENAPLGVEAGVAAGVFTVAVNSGPIQEERLWEAGANLVFKDMESFAQTGFPDILKYSGL